MTIQLHIKKHSLTYVLQFCWFGEVIPIYDKKSGKVDPSILVGLHFKAFPVPVDGTVQALLICVLRLYKLILYRESENNEMMRNYCLCFLKHKSNITILSILLKPAL